MQLTVSGKQLDIGEALQTHVRDAIDGAVSKYFENPVDTHVVFSREGGKFRSDISVHVGKGITVQGHADAGDPYGAFEEAADHIAKRLRRYKDRLRDHHRGAKDDLEVLTADKYVIEDDGGASGAEPGEPMVIAEMTTGILTLSVGEAVMHMDLANVRQLLFRNRAHNGLNMVYRRDDGNIGWVDPRGNREAADTEKGTRDKAAE